MKILIVHQFLWAHYKAAIFRQFQQLVDRTPSTEVKVLQTALYEKARIGFGEVDRSIHQYKYELLFNDVYESVSMFERFKKTLQQVRDFHPDVINLPGYYEPAMVLVQLCCRLMGIKVILSIDSTESDNANVWYKEAIKQFIISQANGFFCYGTAAADYMIKLGAKPSQILMKNNAVDNDHLRQLHDATDIDTLRRKTGIKTDRNYIYIGRLMKIKNVQRLLEAFHNLNQPERGLILVGNGSDKEEILHYIVANKLKNIYFVDAQPWPKIPEYLALSDVLILPSYSEPWGLVVNEAMVCGKAVIVSSKCGCAPDLVENGVNGYTFDPYNVQELADKMNRFVQHPELAAAFGKSGESKIAAYHPAKVAEQMLNGFKTVCTN